MARPLALRDLVRYVGPDERHAGKVGTVVDPYGCDGGCARRHCTTVVFDGDEMQSYCDRSELVKVSR